MPKISVFTSTYTSIPPSREMQETAAERCFYIYTECIPVVNRQHNRLSDDCNREDLYGYKYAFLGSLHQLYVYLLVSAKVSCLVKKLCAIKDIQSMHLHMRGLIYIKIF